MNLRTKNGMGLVVAAAASVALGLSSTSKAQVVGFGGSSETGWTANADGASMNNSVPSVVGSGTSADILTLTTANNSEASSYWFNTPQSITNFTESFTYKDGSGGGADGIAAVWQNAGTAALGGSGGSLGFAGIPTSAGLAMNVYGGNSGSGSEYDSLPLGGNVALTPTPGGVNLDSGDPINVSLSYLQSAGALTETMTDTVTSATFTRVWRNISIAGSVGGSTALIGLTGGTGGVNAQQTVTNFQFTPGAGTPAPAAMITPISATGYNQNMIISTASGSANITATMDNGTNLSAGGDTFFEMGVDTHNGTSEGVPQAGVVFGSATDVNHTFVLQPNGLGPNGAVQDDALMLDASHTTGTLTLTGTSAYSILSFLVAGGQGGAPVNVLINYSNGGTQSAIISVPDWFNNTPIAFDANGRVDTALNDFNNEDDGNPRMYQEDLVLTDTSDAVTNIQFTYGGSPTGNSRTVVFGISGTAVPEPATLGIAAVGAVGLLTRRRRLAR